MKKRIFGIIITLVLCLCLLPVTALASDAEKIEINSKDIKTYVPPNISYDWKSDTYIDTCTLYLDSGAYISDGITYGTIYLTIVVKGNVTINGDVKYSAFGGTSNPQNLTITGSGTLTINGKISAGAGLSISADSGKELTVKVTASGDANNAVSTGNRHNLNVTNAKLIVSGPYNGICAGGLSVNGGAEVQATGNNGYGIEIRRVESGNYTAGDVSVSGGSTLYAKGTGSDDYAVDLNYTNKDKGTLSVDATSTVKLEHANKKLLDAKQSFPASYLWKTSASGTAKQYPYDTHSGLNSYSYFELTGNSVFVPQMSGDPAVTIEQSAMFYITAATDTQAPAGVIYKWSAGGYTLEEVGASTVALSFDNAGTYEVACEVKLPGVDSALTLTKTLTVNPRNIADDTTVEDISVQWYDTFQPVVKYNEKELTYGTEYKITYDGSEIDPSTPVTLAAKTEPYSCTVQFLGNYTGTKTFNLTVTAVPIENVTVTLADNGIYEYNGTAITPVIASVTYKGYTLQEVSPTDFSTISNDYRVTSSSYSEVGDYTFSIEGWNNFIGTKTISYSIVKCTPNVSDTDISAEFTYGDDFVLPESFTWTPTSGVQHTMRAGTDYELVSPTGKVGNVGTQTATIRFTDNANYCTGEMTFTYTVKQATPTITIAENQSVTYDSNPVTAGTTNADILYTYNGDGTVTVKWYADNSGEKGSEIDAPTTVGTYWIGVSTAAGTNYTAVTEVTQRFEITKKQITITAKDQEITYGGDIAKTTDQVTVTLAAGDTLDSITLTADALTVNGGTTITPSAAVIKDGNDDVTYCYEIEGYMKGGLTVRKAAQQAPAAPVETEGATTSSKIELVAMTTPEGSFGNVQYAVSTTNTAPTDGWKESPVFENLSKNTEYYFFARYAGDDNHLPSDASAAAKIKTLNTYTITYNLNNGDGTVPAAQTQDVGTAFTAAAQGDIARIGYTFLGWAKSGAATAAEYEAGATVSDIGETVVLYAVWQINQYTITFDTDGGSEIAAITQDYDTAITAPDDPTKTGHTFVGWDQDIPAAMPAEDVNITANWTANTYTVTLVTNKGTIRGGDVTEYTYGVGAKLPTNVTRSGYYFGGWYDNEDCKGTPVTKITTTDIGNKTFYAKWIYIPPTYSPSVEDTTGGETTVSDKNPELGDKVTITTGPDKGYEVGDITVTDSKGNEVEVIDNGDGTYTYVQPVGKVTITVTYVPEEADFTDVKKDSYYSDAVNWAVAEGITNGVTASTFAPDMVCTRAQVVTFLWRTAGAPEPKSTEMPFTDVAADAYYYDAVLWAVENGITKGTSATTFSPDADCTRGQIVTFLWRSQGSENASGYNPFVDVANDAYYTEAVLWAVENGITNGTGANTFSPDADCTRGQIVTFLYRCLAE